MGEMEADRTAITGVKLSSVVPSRVTGEDKVHELSNLDLMVKLHKIKGVYFFRNEAVKGLTILDLKEPMFPWLDLYYKVSGRIRKSEAGRYLIKCNDGGVRIVEADCGQTMEEWLALAVNDSELYRVLGYNQLLGPDLGFSPLVFVQDTARARLTCLFTFAEINVLLDLPHGKHRQISAKIIDFAFVGSQFTRFKCGGMSVGLSWAHVLGDAFSASDFINSWGQFMSGRRPSEPLRAVNSEQVIDSTPTLAQKPFSVRRVDPIGESWSAPNERKLETHSFHLTGEEVDRMASSVYDRNLRPESSYFVALSAIIWKSLSKIRDDSGPRIVTICNSNRPNRENEQPRNGMILSTVEADSMVFKYDEADLAKLITEKKVYENAAIEEMVERERGESNLIVYGARLTFVNLEEANIYGLELKGEKPVMANYVMEGVGDEGVVLVLPNPKNGGEEEGRNNNGRTVTVILPRSQIVLLKNELEQTWRII